MPAPRVFIIRHGETEWSLNGRHTGTSDIPLTPNGERRILATGKALIGPDRLITPRNLAHVYVSPRRRARRTLELLGLPLHEMTTQREKEGGGPACLVEITERVAEWDYGEYEGRTSKDIAKSREESGQGKWDIWRDGCPGGESPEDITKRLDDFIKELREKFHAPVMEGANEDMPSDVLIVAHGHVLRALAARWIAKDLLDNPSLLLEAGGVGTLSYEHDSIYEPAILLGGAFVVDVVRKVEQEKVKS